MGATSQLKITLGCLQLTATTLWVVVPNKVEEKAETRSVTPLDHFPGFTLRKLVWRYHLTLLPRV